MKTLCSCHLLPTVVVDAENSEFKVFTAKHGDWLKRQKLRRLDAAAVKIHATDIHTPSDYLSSGVPQPSDTPITFPNVAAFSPTWPSVLQDQLIGCWFTAGTDFRIAVLVRFFNKHYKTLSISRKQDILLRNVEGITAAADFFGLARSCPMALKLSEDCHRA
ncbi:hypothetical protein JOB18_020196 [Solea senegalensis]|uniref:Uncharacterized protein n=1 Tax=Solea senegalensis TaxID=28829 RepID=A0AAV6QD54_SOLSE|nr:hypothetical protein JOB18_020196 [Solea senegalensis]